MDALTNILEQAKQIPTSWWIAIFVTLVSFAAVAGYTALNLIAPIPRPARPSEKSFVTTLQNGSRSQPQSLPDWYGDHIARKELARRAGESTADAHTVEEAEVFISVVVPAYNEEERLGIMLEEAVEFLKDVYPPTSLKTKSSGPSSQATTQSSLNGWEILIVSDGSKDKTEDVALDFAMKHGLYESTTANGLNGTRTQSIKAPSAVNGTIRVITLEANRGKGGAVVHGMRHVRGAYVAFADADGASKFPDIARLVAGCDKVKDSQGRAVAIGSRAHLVGSEEVVKRSFLRNALMHGFHVLLRLMTPPKTAAIGDTQCGFKLFTRPALPYIIPYMHSEGWIFDVEMLMLAESADIPMAEVSIGWKEVKGSKLNVIWDSLGMAWGLAVLRLAWLTGVYRRDF